MIYVCLKGHITETLEWSKVHPTVCPHYNRGVPCKQPLTEKRRRKPRQNRS